MLWILSQAQHLHPFLSEIQSCPKERRFLDNAHNFARQHQIQGPQLFYHNEDIQSLEKLLPYHSTFHMQSTLKFQMVLHLKMVLAKNRK